MNKERTINSIALLLDTGLVLLLYQLRIFPEQFKLETSFWDKIRSADSKHLMEIILDAGEKNQIYLDYASASEWEEYFTLNESPINLFVDFLANAPCEITRSAYFEYCKNKGREFQVPDAVSDCIVKCLDVKGGSLYHPCTSSQFFLGLVKKLPVNDLDIYSQFETWEDLRSSEEIRKRFKLHCAKTPANVLVKDGFQQTKFDYIVANPPFNFSFWNTNGNLCCDPRWIYCIPPNSNANFAWLQHVIYHLNEIGKAAVILPNSTLSGGTSTEKSIRTEIIYSGILSAIITFPRKLFHNTTTAFCIWLLNNVKSDNVLFVDTSRLETNGCNKYTAETAGVISKLIDSFNNGTFKQDNNASAIVKIHEIAENDFDLSPNLYLKSNYNINITTDNEKSNLIINKIISEKISPTLNKALKAWQENTSGFLCRSAPLLSLYNVSVGIMSDKNKFGKGTMLLKVKTIINNPFVPDSLNDYV